MNALLIFTHGSHANVIITVCFTPENLMFSHMVSLLKRGCTISIISFYWKLYGIW